MLKDLIEQKDELEIKLKDLSSKLEFYYEKGYDKSLVDSEGFPRKDLEFTELKDYKILSKEKNMLLNDYKQLFKEISEKLVDHHQENKDQSEKEMQEYLKNKKEIKNTIENEYQYNKGFCKIGEILPGSPAYKSNLKENYIILKFENEEYNISNLPQICKDNIDLPIKIIIRDENFKIKKLILVPKKWKGSGILGCRFLPIN